MKRISIEELSSMKGGTGLVIQDCGGDLNEWVDGINDLLTEAGILRDGDRFQNVFVFENNGMTNLLFDMEDVNLNMGELAIWRLRTYENFGGTWLMDYQDNHINREDSEEMEEGREW